MPPVVIKLTLKKCLNAIAFEFLNCVFTSNNINSILLVLRFKSSTLTSLRSCDAAVQNNILHLYRGCVQVYIRHPWSVHICHCCLFHNHFYKSTAGSLIRSFLISDIFLCKLRKWILVHKIRVKIWDTYTYTQTNVKIQFVKKPV